jgi:hypothetical protein
MCRASWSGRHPHPGIAGVPEARFGDWSDADVDRRGGRVRVEHCRRLEGVAEPRADLGEGDVRLDEQRSTDDRIVPRTNS